MCGGGTKKTINFKKITGGKRGLSDQLLNFLQTKPIQKLTQRLITNYEPLDLYMCLRRETCEINESNMYQLKIEPLDNELWEKTKEEFNKASEKCMGIKWPAGDYDTWGGDLWENDAHITWCYDVVTEKPYPYGRNGKDMGNYEWSESQSTAFAGSIYVCFIIPYIMVMKSIQYIDNIPESAFMFVYRGGGGRY